MVIVLMVRSGSLEAPKKMRAELKFVLIKLGELFVMIDGTLWMGM